MPGARDESKVAAFAIRTGPSIAEACEIDGVKLKVKASVGIALRNSWLYGISMKRVLPICNGSLIGGLKSFDMRRYHKCRGACQNTTEGTHLHWVG